MILSFPNWALSSCFTGVAMCGGAPSCMNIVRSTHWRCWSAGRTWLRKSASYRFPVTVQVMGPAGVISSKKNGPTINVAVIPHHTVTCSEWRGNGCSWNGFSVAHILQFCVLTEPCKWKWASSDHRMFHGHSLSTSIRARNRSAKDSCDSKSAGSNCSKSLNCN